MIIYYYTKLFKKLNFKNFTLCLLIFNHMVWNQISAWFVQYFIPRLKRVGGDLRNIHMVSYCLYKPFGSQVDMETHSDCALI